MFSSSTALPSSFLRSTLLHLPRSTELNYTERSAPAKHPREGYHPPKHPRSTLKWRAPFQGAPWLLDNGIRNHWCDACNPGSADSVDVQRDGIEISGVDEPVIDFEHGPSKQYSIALGQYRNRVTVHDLRQMGLNGDGEDMVMASFDLALTFKNGDKMIDFCIKLKEVGYTERQ
ncbi:hypothetical protein WR25_15661 [Diploscapter pachys]|uniref:Uncharacterized protein n=1 Tax=Diploscapter pachys TaxID=2018661 RepID=A0A2A2JC20_9BILA|nr:hypothetical protein WR25_15661 [Diploscapter pachys]